MLRVLFQELHIGGELFLGVKTLYKCISHSVHSAWLQWYVVGGEGLLYFRPHTLQCFYALITLTCVAGGSLPATAALTEARGGVTHAVYAPRTRVVAPQAVTTGRTH